MASTREDPRYCTVSQAAALLGVSRVSIWRWVRDGYLPATRLGPRTIQIERDDVERARMQIQPRGARSWVAQNTSAVGATVDAAAMGLHLEPAADGAPEHAVQFYENDAFLVDAVAEFIGNGLGAGEAGIVAATEGRRRDIEAHLSASGFDLDAARAQGQYTTLDAAETLARFMVDGQPDAERFVMTIEHVVSRAAEGGRRVRIFGEMVALLSGTGNYAAAISLEGLWNDLQRTRRFSLLCAYPIASLGGRSITGAIGDVCAAHSRVIPGESYSQLPTEDDRLQAIVVLQQQSHWLQRQMAERQCAADGLRQALTAE